MRRPGSWKPPHTLPATSARSAGGRASITRPPGRASAPRSARGLHRRSGARGRESASPRGGSPTSWPPRSAPPAIAGRQRPPALAGSARETLPRACLSNRAASTAPRNAGDPGPSPSRRSQEANAARAGRRIGRGMSPPSGPPRPQRRQHARHHRRTYANALYARARQKTSLLVFSRSTGSRWRSSRASVGEPRPSSRPPGRRNGSDRSKSKNWTKQRAASTTINTQRLGVKQYQTISRSLAARSFRLPGNPSRRAAISTDTLSLPWVRAHRVRAGSRLGGSQIDHKPFFGKKTWNHIQAPARAGPARGAW